MPVGITTALSDIYFLPEWGEAYASHDQGKARVFETRNAWGTVYYQFILREIPDLLLGETYFDIITPYGWSGPVIIECLPGKERELAALFDCEFQQYCETNNIISEYVRFNPRLRNIDCFRLYYDIDYRGDLIHIDLTADDYFMEEFKSSTRQQVRRALKNGVTIEFDFTGETIKDFVRLYDLMANRNGIDDYYLFGEKFLIDSFRILEGRQFIINAVYEGKRISTALMIHHGDFLHYHLAANDPDFFKVAGNSLIISEACKWGIANGKKELHLGGSGTEQLQRFKQGFTRTLPSENLTGKKIRNAKIYQRIVNEKLMKGEIINSGFFPAYRG